MEHQVIDRDLSHWRAGFGLAVVIETVENLQLVDFRNILARWVAEANFF
jgi:hypothetical protein